MKFLSRIQQCSDPEYNNAALAGKAEERLHLGEPEGQGTPKGHQENMITLVELKSGHVRPRQATEICTFEELSPSDFFLNFLQWISLLFSRFSV